MDPINEEMLHSHSDGSAPESIEKPKYKCKYCPKRFGKTQALGGHQNAHRKEREMTKRQQMAVLAHLNQPDPDPYPYTYLHLHSFPNQYGFPPGFELPIYKVERPDNLAVVYNQYIGSPSSNFASDPSQGISRGWAFTRLPFQPQPLFSALSPVCLDLRLGVGSSSQTQAWRTEEVTAEKEDDVAPSLSLSLKL